MAIELEGLSFEIEASSEKASKNIDALAESLKALGKVTSSVRGLSSTSNQLKKLSDSLDGFSNRNAKVLLKIANALDILGKVGKIQISSSIGKRISDIGNAAKDVSDDDIDRLIRLANALEKLGKVGDVKIPKMKIPKEQGDENTNQNNVDNNIKAIKLRETTLAVNDFQNSLVPLTQIMQTGATVWEGFEQVVNATGQGISDVAGYLDEGMIEGSFTRLENIAGLLGDGMSKAIVPAEEFSNALAIGDERAITLQNTIEGAWSIMSQGTPAIEGINNELNETVNISQALNSIINFINNAIEEVADTCSGIVTFLGEAASMLGALAGQLALKGVYAGLRGIINLIRKAIGLVGSLIGSFVKLGAYISRKLFNPFEKAKNAIKSLSSSITNLISSFGRIALYRLVRSVIASLTRGLSEGIHNLYQYSRIMNTDFAKSMDKIATAALYVKNSLAAMVSPIMNTIAPAIDYLADKMVGLINKINQFVSALLGKSTYTAAKKLQDTFEKIKSAVIGIDELNIIGDDEVKDYANMFEELPIEDTELLNFVEKLKEAVEKGDWEGLGRLIGGKFNELIDKLDWAGIGEKIGYYLNGIIKTLYFILDEIDFTNFGEKVAQLFNNLIAQVEWEYLGRLIVKQITIVWDFVIGFLTELDWGAVAKALTNYFKGAISEVREWIDKYDWLEMGKILLKKLTDFFQNFDFEGLIRDFSSLVGQAMKALKELLTPLWESFIAWWNNNIKGEDLGKTLKNLADYLINFVDKNILTPFFQAFTGNDELEGGSGLQQLKKIGENIIGGIRKGIEDWINSHLFEWVVKAIFGNFVWSLCKAFGIASPATAMIPYGENIMLGILEGILEGIKNVDNWIREHICTPLIEGFEQISKDIKEIGKKIWDWITEGFTAVKDSIKQVSKKIWDWAYEGFLTLKTTITGIATIIWNWITEGFNFIVDKVKGVGQTVVGWFKKGTENSESETVAKETGNSIITNIEEGASEKITDFDDVGQKIVDCIYNSLTSVADNNELSLIEGLAQNIVTNLVENMRNVLDSNWRGNDLSSMMNDFSSSLVNSIYESLTSTETDNEISLLEKLSADIVTSLINNMQILLENDLRGYDLQSEFKKFGILFTENIYKTLTESDSSADNQLSLLDDLATNIVTSLVNGMKDSLLKEVHGYDIPALLTEFGNALVNKIYESLTVSDNGESISIINDLAARIVMGMIAGMTESLTAHLEEYNMGTGLQEFSQMFTNDIFKALSESEDSNQVSLLENLGTNIIFSLIKNMMTAVTQNLENLENLGILFIGTFSQPIYTEIEHIKLALLDLLKFALDVFSEISSGITALEKRLSDFEQFTNQTFNSIGDSLSKAKDDIQKSINDLNDSLNSIERDITVTITTIHRDVYESSGGGHATGGIIPHALGGIVNKFTLFNYKNQIHSMGEAGREAILPLDSYTGWMDEVAERVDERLTDDKRSGSQLTFEQALTNFFVENLQPVLSQIAIDTQRTANKDMSVKIGNREIRNAYNAQTKIDGYSFTGGK